MTNQPYMVLIFNLQVPSRTTRSRTGRPRRSRAVSNSTSIRSRSARTAKWWSPRGGRSDPVCRSFPENSSTQKKNDSTFKLKKKWEKSETDFDFEAELKPEPCRLKLYLATTEPEPSRSLVRWLSLLHLFAGPRTHSFSFSQWFAFHRAPAPLIRSRTYNLDAEW